MFRGHGDVFPQCEALSWPLPAALLRCSEEMVEEHEEQR